MNNVLDILKRIHFKNDVKLWILAVLLAVGAYLSVRQGYATWGEAKAFLLAAFALPGFFGLARVASDDDDSDDGGSPTPAKVYPLPTKKDEPPTPPAAARAFLITLALPIALLLGGCSLFTKQNARTALDVVQTACVIANAALSDAKVAQICGIADDVIGPMRDLLSASRAAGATRYSSSSYGASSPPPVVCAETNSGVECWAAEPR